MSNDGFWEVIGDQLHELESASSAADVVGILSHERNPYGSGTTGGDGFFAGSGGDDTVQDALRTAGWEYEWYDARYHFCMRAPDGSLITYVEGDIYLGNSRAPKNG
ncbi:hypothetical protein [Lentzea sp. NPDC092896]|uniref:hypothetical protein n=1 Tax=Lentzea sp. NPDC092896 TaxID=3364127 RepID=UPI00382E3479